MRSFFDLVGFEYKKIFKRKGAIISLILGALAICASPLMIFFGTVYVEGEAFESHYQAMVKDRSYAMALSGRAIDEVLLTETMDAYAKVPPIERYGTTPEYQEYARPYHDVFKVYSWTYGYNLDPAGVQNLTPEDLRNYYQTRHNNVASNMRASAISDAAKETLIKLDSEIQTPFMFAYSDGFDALMGSIYTIGIVCAFILAVCLAPMFAGEYITRADQLILSSKLGKNKLVSAKLFTAISLFVVFFTFLLLASVIMCMLIYGYDNTDAPIQLIMPFLAYPLTLLETVLILAVCSFFGTFLVVAITLLLSSKFKSPFGVIIIVSVLLFVPMMLQVPTNMVLLYNLFSLLPASMMSVWAVFSHVPYDFFGLIVLPYVFLPTISVLASIAILPFARKSFRNHQIG